MIKVATAPIRATKEQRRSPIPALVLAGLLAVAPGIAQAAADPDAKPSLEIGVGATNAPGWLGGDHRSTHGTAWINAEYTTRSWGRFQINGGTLTMDPGGNWDPWVKGDASLGLMIGYHNTASLGEERSSRKPGTMAGLDAGAQAVLPTVHGIPLILQARKPFDSDQGWILVVGSYLPVKLNERLNLAILPNARWLDRKQSRETFSTPDGFQPGPAYTAHAGFQDVALEAILDWQVAGRWHWINAAAQRWLTGSAAQTPLTARNAQRSFLSGVSYHF